VVLTAPGPLPAPALVSEVGAVDVVVANAALDAVPWPGSVIESPFWAVRGS
jgi:hypothetical protein